MAPTLRQAILFDGAIAAQGLGGVFITDATGTVIYDSLGPTPRPIDISGRLYFKNHQAGDREGLLISRPIRSPVTGEWTLALSRRIDNPDGSFAGVVVGELQLSYFIGLFNPLAVGTHGGVSLFSTGGWLVARWPHSEQRRRHGCQRGQRLQQDARRLVRRVRGHGLDRPCQPPLQLPPGGLAAHSSSTWGWRRKMCLPNGSRNPSCSAAHC